MSVNYQDEFIRCYQVLEVQLQAEQGYRVTTLSGGYDFEIDRLVNISMYTSSFERMVKDFSELDRDRRRRENCPAARTAYERYRQLIDLVPDNANT